MTLMMAPAGKLFVAGSSVSWAPDSMGNRSSLSTAIVLAVESTAVIFARAETPVKLLIRDIVCPAAKLAVVPTGTVAVDPATVMGETDVTIVAMLLKSPLTINVVGEPSITPRGAGSPDPAIRISFVK